jgi:hypothetical protein
MSRHQRPDRLVLALSPREWAPLEEAFNHIIKAWRGSTELAERDLHEDLLAGRLKSAMRHIARDGTETRTILKPAFWRGLKIRAQQPPDNAGVMAALQRLRGTWTEADDPRRYRLLGTSNNSWFWRFCLS